MGAKALRKITFLCIVFLFISCSDETDDADEPVEIVENVAGFIRTIDFVNSDLILGDLDGSFEVNLEMDEGNNGSLLENIEVFVRLKNNPLDDLNTASQEALVKTLASDQFSIGPDGLPRTLLNLTYTELVAVTNASNLQCGNQFLIRLKLNLSNGKSFSIDDGNSPEVIGFDTVFRSPFCYTINIVDPILDDRFIGFYSIESIIDGPLGRTFDGPIGNPRDSPQVIELKRGDSVNERYFLGSYVASRPNEPSRKFRLVFTCGQALFRKNQISSFFTWCQQGSLEGGITFGGSPNLLGPGDEIGLASENDDSFFELSIAEGYEGWDGECGFGTVNAKVKFTKMEQ